MFDNYLIAELMPVLQVHDPKVGLPVLVLNLAIMKKEPKRIPVKTKSRIGDDMEARNSQGRKRTTELEWTAYHEAGHVVAHLWMGIGFQYVTIIPSGEVPGYVQGAAERGKIILRRCLPQ